MLLLSTENLTPCNSKHVEPQSFECLVNMPATSDATKIAFRTFEHSPNVRDVTLRVFDEND